ncbi:MAG: glycosyltransferase [Desulfobacteraceae bacterium]|nr:glycosyltransferase [Desulfobacteraceae bacterium]MDH3721666.1 glycosyltransferase [Desulfobacteraceae bacterium]
MRNSSTTKPPIVSIITPSYNQGKYIEETIRSVLIQEGDFFIDYIIIDGKSTDCSVEIINKYESLVKEGTWPVQCEEIQYRWISEKDNGQADAINKGFRMAEGDIVAWLNSDDTYLPGTFEKVVGFYETHHDAMFVYGKAYFIREDGKIFGEFPTGPFSYMKLAVTNFICQPTTFFRKDVLNNGEQLNPNLQYALDYDFWIRMAEKFTFEFFPEFLSTFRIHVGSKTISPRQHYANEKESLMTVIRHYNWAPVNKVYGFSYNLIKYKFPDTLVRIKSVAVIISLFVSLVLYIKLNKKIDRNDIKLVNMNNIRKLFKRRLDIITGD